MTVCASITESNASTESTSSQTREPNDSTNGFCRGGARLDESALGPTDAAPVAQGVGGHLGAVVHPDELRAGAALADDLVEHPGRVVGVDRAGHPHRRRLAGVLVDDVEQFQHAAVAGGVELEVQGPDMVGALGSQPLGGHGGLAEPLPLAFPLPHRSNPGCTTLPHVELQRRDGDGGRVVAAVCFMRPEQEHSKSNSSRAPGPSRALSQQ